MSWQTEMVTIVRYLVDDTDISDPVFSNEQVNF
jgi:hypothetical protein